MFDFPTGFGKTSIVRGLLDDCACSGQAADELTDIALAELVRGGGGAALGPFAATSEMSAEPNSDILGHLGLCAGSGDRQSFSRWFNR